jgi:hypothetical protein
MFGKATKMFQKSPNTAPTEKIICGKYYDYFSEWIGLFMPISLSFFTAQY